MLSCYLLFFCTQAKLGSVYYRKAQVNMRTNSAAARGQIYIKMGSLKFVAFIFFITISNASSKGYPWDWQVSKFNHKLSPKNVTDTNVRGTKATALNETVIEGDKASLNCHTRFLKGHTVSWLRKRDSSVLSVGLHTFSSDARISLEGAAFGNEEADWNLQITNVSLTDRGWYECQINTEPKISHSSYLAVNAKATQNDVPQMPRVIPQIQEFLEQPSEIFVIGPRHLRKNFDDFLQLKCGLRKGRNSQNENLYWTFNQMPIKDNKSIQITKLGSFLTLQINHLDRQNSGMYSCQSDDPRLEPATVQLTLSQSDAPLALPNKGERSKMSTEDTLSLLSDQIASLNTRMSALEYKILTFQQGDFVASRSSHKAELTLPLIILLPTVFETLF